MIRSSKTLCPKCGGKVVYYDSVKRIVRGKYGKKRNVRIRRMKCSKCNSIHRELPDFLFPYKHYEADIIIGVIEGLITCDILWFEDYPCEATMLQWRLFPPTLF